MLFCNMTNTMQLSRLSGPRGLGKREHENKREGNLGKEGPFSFFPPSRPFRVPLAFSSSPLSESLEQAK